MTAADHDAASNRDVDESSERGLTKRTERVRLERDPAQPPTTGERVLYFVAWYLLRGLAKLWFRAEIRGREHAPEGAFILAPVHRSYLDFALVSAVLPSNRRLRMLAKDTIWKGVIGRLWTGLGAIPVHRGTPDRDALRASISVVEAGEALVVFPEGTRQSGPTVDDVFDGPAFVQARTGVPIVPVGIGGSEAAMPRGSKFPKRHKIVLIVGDPIAAPLQDASSAGDRRAVVRRSTVRHQTKVLRDAVQRLFDEAQAAAGTPNPETK
jgi:1-acyl-sn-glycerol-3-phosphate acyltransferase